MIAINDDTGISECSSLILRTRQKKKKRLA